MERKEIEAILFETLDQDEMKCFFALIKEQFRLQNFPIVVAQYIKINLPVSCYLQATLPSTLEIEKHLNGVEVQSGSQEIYNKCLY